MKVCEWDNVNCPYCGENKEEYKDGAGNIHGLKELARAGVRSSKMYRPVHHLICFSCGGEFFIPCED